MMISKSSLKEQNLVPSCSLLASRLQDNHPQEVGEVSAVNKVMIIHIYNFCMCSNKLAPCKRNYYPCFVKYVCWK